MLAKAHEILVSNMAQASPRNCEVLTHLRSTLSVASKSQYNKVWVIAAKNHESSCQSYQRKAFSGAVSFELAKLPRKEHITDPNFARPKAIATYSSIHMLILLLLIGHSHLLRRAISLGKVLSTYHDDWVDAREEMHIAQSPDIWQPPRVSHLGPLMFSLW